MLLDIEAGVMNVAAAPRATPELIARLNGLRPSDLAGSCGTCVYQRQPVFVADTGVDPRWQDMRDVAADYGIRSCWSVPVYSAGGEVLGSFAISHLEHRTPDEFHERVLRTASQLAGIAIDRSRLDREREAVLQSQKLESLGLLAGGIAHDFNNLLVGILGNAHLAADEVAEGSEAHDLLLRIQKATEHASQLTRQLLAYAGGGKLKDEPVDLSGLAADMAELLFAGTKRTANIRVEPAERAVATRGDAAQLKQVLMNLLSNAVDATAESGGDIVVRSGILHATPELFLDFVGAPSLAEGDYAFVEVRDFGAGMELDTMQRIFDPFFSTKGPGRGLGLAATLGILKGHGGALRMRSEPGRGTTVRILLPAVADTVLIPSRGAKSTSDARSGTVLIVDDEPVVLAVLEKMLTRLGLRVLRAATSDQAIAQTHRHRDELDAVVLDVTMPDQPGSVTFDALRKIRDDLPILFCSGQSPEACAGLVQQRTRTAFLPKPFDPDHLRNSLDHLLGAAPSR